MDKSEIKKVTVALAEGIREFVRSQARLWQQVPALALKADGRSGFNDNYNMAYNRGIWMLSGSIQNGSYHVAVDCSDGGLIDPFFFLEKSEVKPAGVRDLLRLSNDLEELDVTNIVRHLRKRSKEPVSKHIRELNSEWFAKTLPNLVVPNPFLPSDRDAVLERLAKKRSEHLGLSADSAT